MKKTIVIMLTVMLVLGGCTPLPPSEETGVLPSQYSDGKIITNKTDEIKTENQELKSKLEEQKKELEKAKAELDKLDQNNDKIMEKLTDTENMLKELSGVGTSFPKLNSDLTSKDDIKLYLDEQNLKLEKSRKTIEIIPTENKDNIIIFDTYGHDDGYNQIYIWEIGKNEPVAVEGAKYSKKGSYEWLLQDKYIMLDVGIDGSKEKKIVDVDKKQVISIFEATSSNLYLIPGSANILMQKDKTDASAASFIIYDFITGEEKQVITSLSDKNLKFEADKENKEILFTGTMTDADGIEYSIETAVPVDQFKVKYGVKTIEESEQEKNPVGKEEAADTDIQVPEENINDTETDTNGKTI